MPPPFESLYRNDTLMGDTTLAVMECYRQAGYGIIEAKTGPQDHITAELRFMAMLFYKEFEAAIEIQQHQQYFINKHVLQWVPQYCERI